MGHPVAGVVHVVVHTAIDGHHPSMARALAASASVWLRWVLRPASRTTLVHLHLRALSSLADRLVAVDGDRRRGDQLGGRGAAGPGALTAVAAALQQVPGAVPQWRDLLEEQVALGHDPEEPTGAVDSLARSQTRPER